MHSYKTLQEEQRPWVLHNFGERPHSQPLRGIIEELGELLEAEKPDDIQDALADTMIFTADYCTSMGWDLDALMVHAAGLSCKTERALLIYLGRLNHADLKLEQGIRTNQDHHTSGQEALAGVLSYVQYIAYIEDVNLPAAVDATWAKVRQRDWKADAANAGQSG